VLEGAMKDSVERIAQRRFAADETTMSSVETCHASVRLIHEISKEHGIHLGLTEALEETFERSSGAGRGPDDLAAVYQGMKD
jgi:3-hydroxyisobutyrate dehydrogenase-like beta-hydroxyacid dehydrogenase